MSRLIVLINTCGLLLAACTSEVKQDGRPEWIDRPEPGFVGRCAVSDEDRIELEKCAYRHALGHTHGDNGVIVDSWRDDSIDVMYVLIKEESLP